MTENIANAKLLVSLQQEGSRLELQGEGRLFPEARRIDKNLLGEPVGDGISMHVNLMNRNQNLLRNLPNWLRQDIDELVLVDWSSDQSIADLPGILDDPRVRIIRVEGQSRFLSTLVLNLGTRMCRHRRVFKCDSDIAMAGDFFAAHSLKLGEFYMGDWHQARDLNERHMNGNVYYWLHDFYRVGGYDERIHLYGQDDDNFLCRMMLAGLKKNVFDYRCMQHQWHTSKIRVSGNVHPYVTSYANRLSNARAPLWSGSQQMAEICDVELCCDGRVVRCGIAKHVEAFDSNQYIKEAMRTVGSWFMELNALSSLSDEEVNQQIWAHDP